MIAETQTSLRVTITTPLIHAKTRSRKASGRPTTRGFYVNIPMSIVESLKIEDKELLEVTIRRLK